jgi:hypothetical protein
VLRIDRFAEDRLDNVLKWSQRHSRNAIQLQFGLDLISFATFDVQNVQDDQAPARCRHVTRGARPES